jgi:hypothetical protein
MSFVETSLVGFQGNVVRGKLVWWKGVRGIAVVPFLPDSEAGKTDGRMQKNVFRSFPVRVNAAIVIPK